MKKMQTAQSKVSVWSGFAACLTFLAAWPVYAANMLNTVSVAEGPNETQVIKLMLKDPVEAMPVAFSTSHPHRGGLAFANTGQSRGRGGVSVKSATVHNYQVGL